MYGYEYSTVGYELSDILSDMSHEEAVQYLTEYNGVIPSYVIKLLLELENGNVPQYYPDNILEWWWLRSIITTKYNMWALVDKEWPRIFTAVIPSGAKVLEVMAGAGWLSKAMRMQNIDVVAVDSNIYGGKAPKVTDVIVADAVNYVKENEKDYDILLCSWPTYNNSTMYEIAKAWGAKKTIIYIGEGIGGCTADDAFHANFVEDETYSLPQWSGIHDYIYIGRYNTSQAENE